MMWISTRLKFALAGIGGQLEALLKATRGNSGQLELFYDALNRLACAVEKLQAPRTVSVLLFGVDVEGAPVFASMSDTLRPGESKRLHLDSQVTVASGAWLIAMGDVELANVCIGTQLQSITYNSGGSPVVRLRDAIAICVHVSFDVRLRGTVP